MKTEVKKIALNPREVGKLLGLSLKALRIKNDWTQSEVALQLNLTTSSYSKIEGGDTKISYHRLILLADIYKINLVDLVSAVDTSEKSSEIALRVLHENQIQAELRIARSEIIRLQSKVIDLMKHSTRFLVTTSPY